MENTPTRGNSETKNLNLAFNAVRTGHRDKLTMYAGSIYSTNDATGATPHTTANNIGGGARYDHDITPRLFAFVNTDFYSDDLQTLDLRSLFGGGLGLHAIKNENTTLDLLAGANYTHEKYFAFSRNFAALTLGDEFMHKLGKTTVLHQNFYFFPDMTNTGEYRATFNLNTVTQNLQGFRLAELLRGHLRQQSASRQEKERHSPQHGPQHHLHALTKQGDAGSARPLNPPQRPLAS